MEKIRLDIHENVLDALRKMKALKDNVLELHIPEGSVLFDNNLNLKLLEKEAKGLNKEVLFKTTDVGGLNLIANINGDEDGEDADFVSKEVSFETIANRKPKHVIGRTFSLGVLPKLKFPKFTFKNNLPIFFGIVCALAVFLFGMYQFLWRVPKAYVSVIVNSQPLIKSLEVSVKPDVESNIESKVLKGFIVQSLVTDTSSLTPTGEKTIGKKATGKIKIINRTTEDKDFDKGEKVLSKEDEDLVYLLDDDVTVAKASLQDPMDISSPLVPGTAEVEATAENIGEDYNLSKGEDLEFDDFDESDYVAEVLEDIDGGESKIVKIVAKADMEKLSSDLLKKTQESGKTSVVKNLTDGQTLIEGSVSSALDKEEFSAKIDEETEELKLTQSVSFQGLAYKKSELDEIMKGLLGGFVPEGFELLDTDMETKVEILGNSDATVLNLTQADLQVTIKAFVIPQIDEEDLKKKLVGLSLSEAEKVLGKVRNVKTYGLKIEPNIPILRKLPGNVQNIFVTVNKD